MITFFQEFQISENDYFFFGLQKKHIRADGRRVSSTTLCFVCLLTSCPLQENCDCLRLVREDCDSHVEGRGKGDTYLRGMRGTGQVSARPPPRSGKEAANPRAGERRKNVEMDERMMAPCVLYSV